ncbi:CHASE4 domain-containing protein [Methanosarcina mazei]|jgi:sensor domain CHASE-containing protein/signal transduction histidine kinase/HAMP domain-containing protein|uniref:histidine kinase n=3 Tax=Methanosarcina mazei TaxID=2209 RepID=A0A4P8QZ74_METMZ|nr:CHASE4 domain-containing protein [Methanosarcina mazei]MDO5839895.1 CHASE4 domain-containing protein [Methanosarcina mazei]QCR15230.1 PAS domain-containing protein [Methanosarcina mazei]WIM42575.1 CHASE4 domain-containing protein [Methanosarcina mazei]WIM46037.1 CHASE4 domain-containing protein [Methanosarcina mazei]
MLLNIVFTFIYLQSGVFGINISKKIFIITLLIFAVLITSFALTYNMQLSNFLTLEEADTLNDVERLQNAIYTQQGYLDNMVQDWACWDDTYRFIEDRNQEYINVNLQNETLAGVKVNIMLFINETGSLVYAKSINFSTVEEKPVPEELLKLVESGQLSIKSEDDVIRGYVLLDEAPMFISCHPILTTKYEGPVKGTLVFGKYFDDDVLSSEENTDSSISILRVDEDLPPDFQGKFQQFTEAPDSTIVEPLSKEVIAGYFGLMDISGKSAVIIRTDFPRILYLNNENTLNYMYFFLLLTGLVTGVGVKFALDNFFVSRLIDIDNFVTKVRSEKDLSRRLPLEGNDELYRLSREINGMLSEIELAEQELKSQEREKKVLLDSLNELAIFVDPDFKIIWANKAALEHMKIDLEKAKGMCVKTTPDINGSLFGHMQLEKIFNSGNKESGEFSLENGTYWFVQAIPVTDDSGKIIGILGTFRDITERKAIEKLLQEKQVAEIANRTKSEFLANMSHELRTPLNSIIGFSDLLCDQIYGKLNEKQLKYTNNISKSGKHLLNLINDILDLSKVEAGKMELDYREFELADRLNSVKSLLSPIAARKNIKIEINVNKDLTTICADEARFVQIMYNLVDNAIKFSFENNPVRIEARRKGEFLETTVTDIGIGIKPEDQHKLFQPFSQVAAFSSKKFQGTGLGLSLVKQIVNLHGGYVWFRSIPGEGSTFAFAIPINGNKKD